MKLSMILARSIDNVIGIDGKLPWDCPADLAMFKQITSGPNKAVVMGRNTWNSLPKRPLPGRHNFVITSDGMKLKHFTDALSLDEIQENRLTVTSSIADTIELAKQSGIEELIFIGGKAIYESAVKIVDEVHLTEMNWHTLSDNDRGGDKVFFDHDFVYDKCFDQPKEWNLKERTPCLESDTGKELFEYLHLVRK